MGWFKKEEKVPEIPPVPEMPRIPDFPTEKRNLPELPSFPENSKNENFNQDIVKSAVGDDVENGYSDDYAPVDNEVIDESPSKGGDSLSTNIIPELPKKENLIPSINSERKRTLEISSGEDNRDEKNSMTKQVEPIFVRIDKFQSAQKNFDKIKAKAKEIEIILRKIKSVKEKEDKEIQGWAEDLEMVKSRLAEIESDIFDKI